MEKQPFVSVLMPVYNGRDYLRPAIESILNQTFKDFELLIINDGSKDDSQEIINSYKDPRIVSVVQENQGVARSLNNGLKIARGKYVRRHDADDISTADSLQIQVDFLESHPEYVMVCNQQAFMTLNGFIAYKYRVPNNKFFEGKPLKDLSFDDFATDRSSPVVHGTACFRRQDVLDLGCYRTEFIVSEDNDLWLRLLERHKIGVMNVCNYYMRIHPGSATHRHAHKIQHFRNLLVEYSQQRRTTGSDPIMRGEPVPPPPPEKFVEDVAATKANGSLFREDLRYMYGLVSNAGDKKVRNKIAKEIIHDGWKDSRTWKMLLFPILGEKLIAAGVSVKKMFR
jgi:glycosyltransferase involved in cell wall biosynthesis